MQNAFDGLEYRSIEQLALSFTSCIIWVWSGMCNSIFVPKIKKNSADKNWLPRSLWTKNGVQNRENVFRRQDGISTEVVSSIANAKGKQLSSSIIINANRVQVQCAGAFGPTRSINNRSKGRGARTTAEGYFDLKNFGPFSLYVLHQKLVNLSLPMEKT